MSWDYKFDHDTYKSGELALTDNEIIRLLEFLWVIRNVIGVVWLLSNYIGQLNQLNIYVQNVE